MGNDNVITRPEQTATQAKPTTILSLNMSTVTACLQYLIISTRVPQPFPKQAKLRYGPPTRSMTSSPQLSQKAVALYLIHSIIQTYTESLSTTLQILLHKLLQ